MLNHTVPCSSQSRWGGDLGFAAPRKAARVAQRSNLQVRGHPAPGLQLMAHGSSLARYSKTPHGSSPAGWRQPAQPLPGQQGAV